MNKKRLADDLDAAADYRDKHGEARKKFVTMGGRVCAVGALRKATSSSRARQAWRHMDQRTARQFGTYGVNNVPIGLTDVNDARLADIPKLFRKEAARLRGGSARKGVTRQAQKDARKADEKAKQEAARQAGKDARQQPCAAPSSGSGSRAGAREVLIGVALVVAIGMVWHFAALLLTVLQVVLLVAVGLGLTAAGAWAGVAFFDAFGEQIADELAARGARIDWAYLGVWLEARRAEREVVAVQARRDEVLEGMASREQLFAIGPADGISDEALRAAWMPEQEAEPVRRR